MHRHDSFAAQPLHFGESGKHPIGVSAATNHAPATPPSAMTNIAFVNGNTEEGKHWLAGNIVPASRIDPVGAALGLGGGAQDLSQIVLDVTFNLPISRTDRRDNH